MGIEYLAIDDIDRIYTTGGRRYAVVKFCNGEFAYVCGMFNTMKAAEKRAAWLNRA